jgi:(2R)-3-sulfolactate dehydrogenase (NADP+)
MAVRLTLDEVEELTQAALTGSGVRQDNARSVTRSVVASEADGIHSHGLARLPTYCEHARCGKIDGQADPRAERVAGSGIRVDACDGFAHPAIDLGLDQFLPLAQETAVAGMAVTRSYNCGVVGYHVERIADAGMVALGFVNAPASIAPWGGSTPVFGTNPLACAIPRKDWAALVVDQSSSVVAKSEIVVHKQKSESIPRGWALDADGHSTTDPEAALAGSMLPMAGHKGSGIALIVEVLAAAVTGSNLSIDASSFADNKGGSPRTGQFFLGIDPAAFGGDGFSQRLERLVSAIESQDGARLPGQGRLRARERTARDGVEIDQSLHDKISGYAANA